MTDDPREDELMELLDSLGEEQRRDLAAARADDTPPGRAEAALARALEARAAELGPTRPQGWGLAAAAAVLLATALTFLLTPDQDAQDDLVMGVAIGDMAPRGAGADLGRFRFSADLGGEVWARISVYDADAPADAPPLAESPPLRTPSWDVDPAEAATWTRIRWTLEVFSGAAAPVSLARVQVEAER